MATDSTTPLRSRLDARAAELFGALRYRDFRRFWFGSLASLGAQQSMILMQGWLVYDLTDSALYLGYVGLVSALPALFLTMLGGVLADRVDLRRLLFLTQVVVAGLTAALATLAAFDLVEPWHVLILAFLTSGTQAFNNPARQAVFPPLVDRKDLMNAVSLNAMIWHGTRIVAPSAAGFLYAAAGPALTFYACALGYVVFAAIVLTLRVPPPSAESSRQGLRDDMTQGVRYVLNNSLFVLLIGLTFCNSFFGLSLLQIMPVFARDVLAQGPSGLGLLMTSVGVGSTLGLLIASTLGKVERKGLLIISGAVAYAFFLILFSQSTIFGLSIALLFTMSIFNQIYMITVQTMLQMGVPAQLRGRVMGIYTMTFNLGPLGALQAGALASAFSPSFSVLLGGSAIILTALGVAASKAEIRDLRTPDGAG